MWLKLAVLLFLVAGVDLLSAEPIPVCQPATLDHYLGLGVTCVGGSSIVYKDFSFSSSVISGQAVGASSITVIPESQGLLFLSSFQVTPVDSVTYQLGFTADDPHFGGMEDTLSLRHPTGSAHSTTDPGVIDVHTIGCPGSLINLTGPAPTCPGPMVTLHVFKNDATFALTDSATFAPTTIVGILNTIQVQANGTDVGVVGLENDLQIVTEPPTLVFGAIGLVGMLVLRRRLRCRTARRV